ncbi:TIGR00159 family protein [Acetobacterium fimetarium]|uniref:Diadenylate cyclase n=1 Tax=Acetobacterium fimetarium TaxID=52691 RepID=A0ABR6WU86_9FIRM|nr:diadenylate cyclase CdaA [Acetobacterium fimetarium]MBC3803776.1 TIGR00159 family protein [Acetobacterium fimetarium]
MEEFLLYIQSRITVASVIEVCIIAFIIYRLLLWIRGTQAEQVFKGLILLLFCAPLCSWLGFTTLNLIITSAFTWAFILIVVVFQPEFRSALEQLGNNRVFKEILKKPSMDFLDKDVDKIIKSVKILAEEKTGALIVLEKNTGLNNIVDTGIELDAEISSELLENIFTPNRPLHDGAVIIKLWSRQVRAAGCLLPLSDNRALGSELGTRHRAGLGMTEKSDSVVIIVSEETGHISYAIKGTLYQDVIPDLLTQVILENFTVKEDGTYNSGWLRKLWENKDGK